VRPSEKHSLTWPQWHFISYKLKPVIGWSPCVPLSSPPNGNRIGNANASRPGPPFFPTRLSDHKGGRSCRPGFVSRDAASQPGLPLEALLRFWREEMEPYDEVDRLFRLLKHPQAECLVKEDFYPILRDLLDTHPGMEFLRTHPDFQQKYALTVITRIFYKLNRSGSGRITRREFRRSALVQAMRFVDGNDDINKEMWFFSYEHFYVLYCRFWELDTDRDSWLSREDLLKYGEHSLSSAIVDRVFEVGARPFGDGRGGKRARDKMGYADFVYFMLSEEDKGNEARCARWPGQPLHRPLWSRGALTQFSAHGLTMTLGVRGQFAVLVSVRGCGWRRSHQLPGDEALL
jgi:hypothetical protein